MDLKEKREPCVANLMLAIDKLAVAEKKKEKRRNRSRAVDRKKKKGHLRPVEGKKRSKNKVQQAAIEVLREEETRASARRAGEPDLEIYGGVRRHH